MKYIDHENRMAIESAIRKLRPDAGFSIRGAGVAADDEIQIEFDEGVAPLSAAEISAQVEATQAFELANAYQKKRQEAYPSIGDQLDMQWHDAQDGTTTWVDHVAAVKAAHPKG